MKFRERFGNVERSAYFRNGLINRQRREYIADIGGIINVGNGLRKRHLDYILQELNSMCSSFFGCYFEIDEIIGV